MNNASSNTDLPAIAVSQTVTALEATIPLSDADMRALDQMARQPIGSGGELFFYALQQVPHPATPGIWTVYLRLHANFWNEPEWRREALLLPQLRREQRAGDDDLEALLDAAAETIAGLATSGDEGKDEPRAPIGASLTRLARGVDGQGQPELAYNLSALALDLGDDQDESYEEVARCALSLALDAGKSHQIAMCSTALAKAIVCAADAQAERRLEAFDACESALERIMQVSEPYSRAAAHQLAPLLNERPYLRHLLIPLLHHFPGGHLDQLRQEIQADSWPPRIAKVPEMEWKQTLQTRLAVQRWEWEIEKARFALEKPSPTTTVYADWVDWTVDHPAYRRAVPHLGSFLRERDFDQNFLMLSHEITHVLSLLGGFGIALGCLRAAAFHSELNMWAITGGEPAGLAQRISTEGVGPLPQGNAAALFLAEQGLELTLKTRSLQDTWTAWFEGLAMFGELTSDPTLDDNCIGHVHGCLRNFADFVPSPEQRSSTEAYLASYTEFASNFEQRCSDAIANQAPDRLRQYLDHEDAPYFSGYLAVRSVIASWRRSAGVPVSAPAAFNLLLHATRHVIHEGLPELSLPADQFAAEAHRKMAAWVAALSRLDGAEIRDFIAPIDPDTTGPVFHWAGMHVRRYDGDVATNTDAQQLTRQLAHQALLTLAQPGDELRVDGTPEIRALLAACAKKVREATAGAAGERLVDRQMPLIAQLLRLNGLLPIGRTQSKFFVNAPPDNDLGYLGVQLRTTEHARDSGRASVNEIWLPINKDDARAIERVAAQTGSPRMEIVRLIDLTGDLLADDGTRWAHLIALRYGDWCHLYGPNPAVQTELEADPERRAAATATIQHRLQPAGMLAAEMTIARGRHGAARTHRHTEASQSWHCHGIAASAWARHVHERAAAVLDSTGRTNRQRQIGLDLLRALQIDTRLVQALADGNFSHVTSTVGRRGDIIDALLLTGRDASNDQSIAALAQELANADLPLFEHGPSGWDVGPAK